jgi:hypothetical protein
VGEKEVPEGVKQGDSVDVHEKALDIQLQDPTIPAVIERTLPDEMVDASDAIVGALAFAAGTAVAYELFFEQMVHHGDDEMMDDAIPESGREDFALDRFFHDEGCRSSRFIASVIDFRPQCDKMVLVVGFESHCACAGTLGPPALEICLKYIAETYRIAKSAGSDLVGYDFWLGFRLVFGKKKELAH